MLKQKISQAIPVLGMSLRKVTWLSSNLASVTDLKESKLHTVYFVISEAVRPLQLVGQVAKFKFESKFEPLQVIWQSLWRLFQKVIEGLEGKINGQALGAALRLCLRGSDGRAQTQGVSESAAVAAGRDRLAWGKHATTLAILTQFKNQQGFNALLISGRDESLCVFMWNESLGLIFLSVIGLWVKIWHRNKTTCSKWNPVQSSRSKSTTCPRKGCLLRFESNSTATSDGRHAKACKQYLAWFWIDCNQSLQANWSQMKYDVWKQCSDQWWQDTLLFSIWRFF